VVLTDTRRGDVADGDRRLPPRVAWRICQADQADLSSEEACKSSGRWNSDRRSILYFSDTPALALLELRVHLDATPEQLPKDFVLLQLPLPPGISVEHVDEVPDDSQAFGDRWLDECRSAVLLVPSVIIPVNVNVLVNPEHPEARELGPGRTSPVRLDERLWAPFDGS
jgi:RES domain-containing protein